MQKNLNAYFYILNIFICTCLSLIIFSSTVSAETKAREYQTLDLISNIDSYNINNERLRFDSAKAHYNMGNIYFYKGEYEIASA